MKTSQAVKEFLTSRGGLRPKSVREYRKHLALFRQRFPNELPEKPYPIQAWLNGQKGTGGRELAPETVHARFRTVRAMYHQLHRWHPKLKDPMPLVRPPQLQTKVMRTFTDNELLKLFNQEISGRDIALLSLLIDVGPRAGECASLNWDDIIPGFVTLRGKTGERTVPISETTYRRLQTIRNGSRHVFVGKRGPLTYEGIYKIVRRLCQQAGITGRRTSPHTFRHTFGTNYAAADGCDPKVLQDIMGHRDFKTTLRYIQNNPKRMARNHQRCSPLKIVDAAAQWNFFDKKVLQDAEAILAEKGPEKGAGVGDCGQKGEDGTPKKS